MANSRKKGQKTKTPENAASACGETIVKTTTTGTPPKENGDLRTAIVDMLLNDDAVMQTIINAVSDALVSKFLANKDFMATLADKLLSHGALDTVKQSVYEASAMDNSRTYASVTAMEGKLSALDNNSKVLSDEMDALEQYSRRNCLLFHGVPETDADDKEEGTCHNVSFRQQEFTLYSPWARGRNFTYRYHLWWQRLVMIFIIGHVSAIYFDMIALSGWQLKIVMSYFIPTPN